MARSNQPNPHHNPETFSKDTVLIEFISGPADSISPNSKESQEWDRRRREWMEKNRPEDDSGEDSESNS